MKKGNENKIEKIDELIAYINNKKGHKTDFDGEVKDIEIRHYKYESFEKREMLITYGLNGIGIEIIKPLLVSNEHKSEYRACMTDISSAFGFSPVPAASMIGLKGKITLKIETVDEELRLSVLKFAPTKR